MFDENACFAYFEIEFQIEIIYCYVTGMIIADISLHHSPSNNCVVFLNQNKEAIKMDKNNRKKRWQKLLKKAIDNYSCANL